MKGVGVLFMIGMVTIGYTQAPDTLWTRTYGGTGSDAGNVIRQTSDGGFIIAGYTESFGAGQQDIWLVKIDANGDILWTETYGDAGHDWAADLQVTTDGGYIIGANTESADLDQQIWLIKTDSLGSVIWTRIYGGPYFSQAICNAIQQTSDGGYIITGIAPGLDSQLLLMKTDADGDTLWYRSYHIYYYTRGNSVCETSDGGYVIAANALNLIPNVVGLLIKTDANGDIIWENHYIDNISHYSMNSVIQASDSEYVACGVKSPFSTSDARLFVVKTKDTGDSLWIREYGNYTNRMDGSSLQLTNNSMYIFTGICGTDIYNNPNIFLFKTDKNGDSLWCVIYGDSDYPDRGNEVCQANDGGYVIVGGTESYGAGGSDVWIIKTEPDLGVEERPIVSSVETHEIPTATIFRGPLRLPENKKCRVYDITGRLVEPTRITRGIYFIGVDGEINQKIVRIR
jgi:hypothetical protein